MECKSCVAGTFGGRSRVPLGVCESCPKGAYISSGSLQRTVIYEDVILFEDKVTQSVFFVILYSIAIGLVRD